MSHVRTQLRAALQAALTGLPSVTAVFVNRAAPISAAQTPCIRITTPREQIDAQGLNEDMHERTITVLVECFVKGETLDDAADQAGLEVESAIAAAGDLNGLTKGALTLRETALEIEETVTTPLAMMRMAYTAQIYTLAAAPDTAI